ncbi:hypothetical protein ACFOND_02080 [Reinekea marina]|uniref:Uncharacterized protein n=2 Tax=Reinekea marina TaxID=1310421 RepID=A0ABV7WNQ8_9GAMM
MQNVAPLISIQNKDHVENAHWTQRDINILKTSIDLYRKKASDCEKENAALRMLLTHYKEMAIAPIISTSIPSSQEHTSPLLDEDKTTNRRIADSNNPSETAILKNIINKLQNRLQILEGTA